MSKKILGYTRVSTEEQSKLGHSLEFQLQTIEQYLHSNLKLKENQYDILTDAGQSASTMNRPAMKKILKRIESNKVEILIFHKLDRVSRSLIDFSNLVKLCTKHNVSIISINENFNFSNANGRGMANLLMCFAQMEREQIIERTNNGLIAKLMKGQYANGGKLPFGVLKDENHKVSFDPDKKKILMKMFELYKNCYSIQGITNKINKDFTLNLKYKQVVSILNNTIYFGYVIKAGTKYPIVEPLINEDEIINNITATKILSSSLRYRSTANIYKYKNLVFFNLNEKLIPAYNCTNYKYNSRGYTKYVFYYITIPGRGKIYVNEKDIDVAIAKANLNKDSAIIKKSDQLQKMFLKNQISEDEYLELKSKLVNIESDDICIGNVEKIIISKDKHVEVIAYK